MRQTYFCNRLQSCAYSSPFTNFETKNKMQILNVGKNWEDIPNIGDIPNTNKKTGLTRKQSFHNAYYVISLFVGGLGRN